MSRLRLRDDDLYESSVTERAMNGLDDNDREGQAPVIPSGDRPPPAKGSVSLRYRDGRDDLPGRSMFVLNVIGGLATSSIGVAACGFVWVLCNLPIALTPTAPKPRLNWGFSLPFTVVVFILLGALTVHQHRRGYRGFALGMLIGFGLTMLLETACFAWR